MSILLASHPHRSPALFHPQTGDLESGPHRFTPRGHVAWTLGPEDLVALTHDDTLLLCDPTDLAPVAKLSPPGMPWRHIAACGRHIVAIDRHLNLQLLDWFTRTRHTAPLGPERDIAALWTNSTWLALHSRTDQGWGVSLWKIRRSPPHLTPHTPRIRRPTTGPTAALDPRDTWCAMVLPEAPKDMAFLYTSTLPGPKRQAGGWRGLVEGVDLRRGEVVWEVAIEGSWTHDPRPTEEVLTPPDARGVCVVPALRPGTQELWVGSVAGSAFVFDARDGALLDTLHLGGTREVVSHLWDDTGGHLMATRGGGWTCVPT